MVGVVATNGKTSKPRPSTTSSFGESFRITASLYHDAVDNAIRFVPPPPPPPLYANVGQYTVDGLELSLQAEPAAGLTLFLGGTYSEADPETVPNLPKTTGVGGLAYSAASGWRLTLDLQWVDNRYVLNPRFGEGPNAVDAYLLANAKIGIPWRWFGLAIDGSVFIAGENLTDERYEHRLGYPMPERSVQVGVDIAF